MNRTDSHTVWVCTDCIMLAANGETHRDDTCKGIDAEYGIVCGLPIFDRGDGRWEHWDYRVVDHAAVSDMPAPMCLLAGDDVSIGMLWADHADDCPRAAGDTDYECDCEVDQFSSRPCSGCGSWLAGERHAMTVWI